MTETKTLKMIKGVKEMQTLSTCIKKEGKVISFVPTMGALHDGHLSLMREGRKRGDVLVASVFVNPTQFGPGEDYKAYTRNIDGDVEKMKQAGVDVAFVPEAEDIYPPGFETYVEVSGLGSPLCGRFRPGHFRGVATVVLKLFNIVKPDIAIFGQKDYQQLQIIKKMVRDLSLEIEIKEMPIVREPSGLAMSSRNSYLSAGEREKAVCLSQVLFDIKKRFEKGERDTTDLIESGYRALEKAGLDEIDYLEIRDGKTLEDKKSASHGDVVALAAHIGSARLIDNIVL